MDERLSQAVARELNNAQSIRLTSHIHPDGDAIGSLVGMGLSLQAQGKKVEMVLQDGIPAALRFIPGCDMIMRDSSEPFELLVTLDCSDENRVGIRLDESAQVDINIDHHATNTAFARLNLVDDQAVATAEILAIHLPEWGFPIDHSAAEALLTGILTDTIGFRTNNMNSQALRVAADLVETGADLVDLYNKALVRRSFPSLKYWGYGLSRMKQSGRIVWTTLTGDDRSAASYTGNDDADLINLLSTIDGADVIILFNGQGKNQVKVSWRCISDLNVSSVALLFGGGGHPCAAGADIEGNLEEIQDKVIETTSRLLELNRLERTNPS